MPAFARPHQQAAVLRLQLEDLTERDIQASSHELRGGTKEVGPRHPRERLLAEVRNRFLLARGRAELLIGAARLLDAQPSEPLRSHPCSVRGKGSKTRWDSHLGP